jgi:hypothetical protein
MRYLHIGFRLPKIDPRATDFTCVTSGQILAQKVDFFERGGRYAIWSCAETIPHQSEGRGFFK